MNQPYQPIIVAFLCNWCSYRAADLAGTSRINYAPTMRPIRVMCTARVEPQFVIKALREGADGVLIAGCHPGECHYVTGNMRALRRYKMLKRMLQQWGVEDERVQLLWAAASESQQLADKIDEMTIQLRKVGPLRWKQSVMMGVGGKSTGGVLTAPAATAGEVTP